MAHVGGELLLHLVHGGLEAQEGLSNLLGHLRHLRVLRRARKGSSQIVRGEALQGLDQVAEPAMELSGLPEVEVEHQGGQEESAGQPGLHETGLGEGEDDHLPGGGGRQQGIEPPEQGGQDHEEGSEEEQGRQPEGGQGKGGASLRGKPEPSGTGLPGHGFPQS